MQDSLLSVDLRLFKGLLLVNHLTAIKIFDFQTMNLTDSLNLNLGCSAMQFTTLDCVTNQVRLIRKLANKLDTMTFTLDLNTKKVVPASVV